MFFLNVRVVLKLLLNIFSPSSVQSITYYYLFLPGARYTHYHRCHWHSVDDMVFTAWQWRKTRVSTVLLMGQMYSDEDVRGLFSFLSKAGNGKSVPRRNHVLPDVEGLCLDSRSCQTLIREPFTSPSTRAPNPFGLLVCECVSAGIGICQSICLL